MDTSRRQFLIGVGGGLLLPSFYTSALRHYETTNSSLLLKPKNPTITLGAYDWSGEGEYALMLGRPDEPLPDFWFTTWQEYADKYMGGHELYADEWERDGIDPEDQVDQGYAEESWILRETPNAKAYMLLEGLDLQLDDAGDDSLGTLEFLECPTMGSCYRGVHGDALAMSLLQKRLIDINADIEIVMGEKDAPEPDSKVLGYW